MSEFLRYYNKIVKVLLAVTLFVPLIHSPLYATTVERILATVNDEFITLSDYILFLKREGYTQAENVDEDILKRMIEERLIVKEARNRGITTTDSEIEEMLGEISKDMWVSREEIIGMLMEKEKDYKKVLRDKVIALKLIKEEVDTKVIVNEKEIEQFYNEHKDHYRKEPEKVEIETLFIPLPPEASVTEITDFKLKSLRILKMIREGEDFEGVARRYGEFRRLGSFEKGALLDPLNEIAFSLNEGEISNPIWTDEGVFIIKVIKRFEPSYQPLSNVRNQIYRILFESKRAEIRNDWLRRLWEGAAISIKD